MGLVASLYTEEVEALEEGASLAPQHSATIRGSTLARLSPFLAFPLLGFTWSLAPTGGQ